MVRVASSMSLMTQVSTQTLRRRCPRNLLSCRIYGARRMQQSIIRNAWRWTSKSAKHIKRHIKASLVLMILGHQRRCQNFWGTSSEMLRRFLYSVASGFVSRQREQSRTHALTSVCLLWCLSVVAKILQPQVCLHSDLHLPEDRNSALALSLLVQYVAVAYPL